MIPERERAKKVWANNPETGRKTGTLSLCLTLGSNINNTYIIELLAVPILRREVKWTCIDIFL